MIKYYVEVSLEDRVERYLSSYKEFKLVLTHK